MLLRIGLLLTSLATFSLSIVTINQQKQIGKLREDIEELYESDLRRIKDIKRILHYLNSHKI